MNTVAACGVRSRSLESFMLQLAAVDGAEVGPQLPCLCHLSSQQRCHHSSDNLHGCRLAHCIEVSPVSALWLLQLKPAGVSQLVQRVLDIEGKQSHFSLKDRSGQGGMVGP
jgi:hypothetical protein